MNPRNLATVLPLLTLFSVLFLCEIRLDCGLALEELTLTKVKPKTVDAVMAETAIADDIILFMSIPPFK
ncbi:MAG: hypothetical protein ACKO99_20450 [Dolichospermum sp.]